MPNVRGAQVRRFSDTTDLWPLVQDYAERHGIKGGRDRGASEVIRIAVDRLLADDKQEDK